MPDYVIPAPKPKPPHIDNTALVTEFRDGGGHIFHLPPNKSRRGITFAYVQKGRRFELATAVQHSADDFTKKMGTKTAIEHFQSGKTIVLPLRTGMNPLDTLRIMGWA